MRIGSNPHKDKTNEPSHYFHQIIIPVYIPSHNDYYKDSLKILDTCLQSLFKTTHSKTFISIINNGCCIEVYNYLNQLTSEGKIQEVIHTTNIGKLNAILKGLTGNKFTFVTVTDADVLFLNNWQEETYKVFENFPKAGAVSPVPSPRTLSAFTENIYINSLFSKSLKFTKVKNPEALKAFAVSIGSPNLFNKYNLDKYLTISSANCKAVVGAGHFVTTYRWDVFDKLQIKHSKYKLGGSSEETMLDIPVVKRGLWRVATEDNFAYHMGNVFESWMDERVGSLAANTYERHHGFNFKKARTNKLSYWLKHKFIGVFLMNKLILKYILIFKGLSKEQAENYKRSNLAEGHL